MPATFPFLALLTVISRAYAVDPADVRRLASDPDTTAEALAAGVKATTESPRDPQALAALIEAIGVARGPTLAGGPVKSATLGEGARTVLVVDEDGTRRVFDARTGAPTEGFAPAPQPEAGGTVTAGDGVCVVTHGGPVGVLAGCTDLAGGAVSPDSQRAVTLHAPSRTERTEVLWDVSTGKPLATLRTDVNPAGTWTARFSPDSSRFFTYDNGGLKAQNLYDASGAVVAVLGPSQRDGAFMGEWLVLADADLQAFDTDGTVVGRLGSASWPVAFLADGHTVAVPGGGRTILWDLEDGGTVEVLGAWDAAGSDGRRVLAGRPGGPVRVVDTGPAGAAVYGDPGAALAALAMAPDGALASADALRVRMWDADGERVLDAGSANVRWLAFAPSRLVASSGKAWDLEGHRVAQGLFRYLEQVVPGPTAAYAWDKTGAAPSRFRDLFTGATRARVAKDTAITGGSFSSDGSRFAGAAPTGLGAWDVATGRRLLAEGDGAGWTVALSADGRRVAGFARDARDVTAWTIDGGGPWLRVRLRSAASAVALPDDGGVLAIGDVAGRLWVHRPGEDPVATAGHEGPIRSLAFSSGLLLSSSPGRVRLWDAATGTLLADWSAASEPLARFGPDGDVVLLAASDGTVQVWPATVAGWQAIACGWLAYHPAGEGVCP